MARTVDTTYDQPEQTSLPNLEIADVDGQGGGVQEVATALNTLYEQARGSWVDDFEPSGLLSGTGTSLLYRCRTWGGQTSILARVYAYVETALGGSCTVRAQSSTAGDSTTVAVPGSTGPQWVDVGTLDMATTAEYEQLEIDLSAVSGTVALYGVSVYAERGSATLADATDDFAYSDGFVPLDVAEYGGERSLTATKTRHLHENARTIWEQRHPQVAATYWVGALSDVQIGFLVPEPAHHRSSQTATLRCHVRYRWTGSSAGVDLGTITLGAGGVSSSAVVSSGGTATWGTLDLSIDIPSDATPQPTLLQARLAVSGDVEVTAISGWWRDLSYG